jgi:hypothetical protein
MTSQENADFETTTSSLDPVSVESTITQTSSRSLSDEDDYDDYDDEDDEDDEDDVEIIMHDTNDYPSPSYSSLDINPPPGTSTTAAPYPPFGTDSSISCSKVGRTKKKEEAIVY